jgi:hypothetical protein
MARAAVWAVLGCMASTLMMAGCDEVFTAGGVATVTPMFATITARDLRDLDPDESLQVELDGAYPTVFEFDGRDGAIDFRRIEIATPDVESISMHLWLARQVPTHGIDFAGLPGARFRLANDRMAASLGIPDSSHSQPRSCEPADIVELDDLVAVLFAADAGC